MNAIREKNELNKISSILLWLFCFFIAFPVIDIPILNVSITFPIFLLIVILNRDKKEWQLIKNDVLTRLLMWMFTSCIISIIMSWLKDTKINIFYDILSIAYAIYWFYVFVFFRNFYNFYNFENLATASLIGCFANSLLILLGNLSQGWYKIGPLQITQNSFALTLVSCIGIFSLCKLFTSVNILTVLGIAGFFIFIALKCQSRTGGFLVFIELYFIIFLNRIVKQQRHVSKFIIILLFVIPIFILSNEKFLIRIGESIYPVSPRLGEIFIMGGKVNERDKSYLIRKIQIEKGIMLFKEHPIFGIGWRHFSNKFVDIDISKYLYLHGDSERYSMRSSHNTYIQQLAETGIIGIIPLIFIQLWVLWNFYINLGNQNYQSTIAIGISLIAVAFYFWVISALTGALWYIILGIFGATIEKSNKN